jgi:RNA methyltransferase, TrmH family
MPRWREALERLGHSRYDGVTIPSRRSPNQSMRITSLQNPRVKQAVQLRDRKGREQQQRLIIDGRREILTAVLEDFEILEAFVHPATSSDEEGIALREMLEQQGVRLWEVTESVFRKLSFGNRDEGLVAISRPRHRGLADLPVHSESRFVVLDGVEKPGNIGAVLRTADATGVSGLILTNGVTDVFNPNIVRASLGAVFTIPVVVTEPRDVLEWLDRQQIATFAARVDGSTPYFQHDFREPVAFVLGSEAEGLGANWSSPSLRSIHLPMRGRIDSLNVSNTAAVLLYEMVRQRHSR